MHAQIPNSQVSVSVLASSVKEPKLYDIHALANASDEIFMMAYDFATTSADNAMPTDPLYGYKQGQYWYDVSTAVEDFLTQMSPDKLVLGLPWYGYNYPVYQPQVKAPTLTSYYAYSMSQPYKIASDTSSQSENYVKGWDTVGQTSWKAYYDSYSGTWRMIFYDDPKAMALRYDFVKKMHLAGTGMWALGFEDGNQDLWNVLEKEFGAKPSDISVNQKVVASTL
jgi:spore germination protein YaaH